MSKPETPTETGQTTLSSNSIPQDALVLGLGGLVPFIAGALAVWLFQAGDAQKALLGFLTYGAVILSFLGGVRWGLVIKGGNDEPGQLSLSVVPALMGWGALLLPQVLGVIVLLLSFMTVGVWDVVSARRGLAPKWYEKLRFGLTIGAALCHIAVLARLFA